MRSDNTLGSVDIVDLMNMIGKCVVAGNVRRTAEIAFGDPDDIDYCEMKNPRGALLLEERAEFDKVTNALFLAERYEATVTDFQGCGIDNDRLSRAIELWNALNSHRWASNNSIFAKVGMDYSAPAESTAENGEPGYLWLNNIRNFGRMIDGPQPGIDRRAMGSNPCVEQTLESNELCCLVETFPSHHDDAEDYKRTLKFAYLYAKTVTLLPTHNAKTNAVMQRNRRIGLSQSGIIQAFKKFGYREVLSDFCDEGYKVISKWDEIYSEWLCVGKSIKKTSVKPSGTVSLVAGTTAGIHYTIAPTRAYWRNVRIANDDPLLVILRNAGYHIEPDHKDDRTSVVRFGVHVPDVETAGEVSIWEQVKNAADYQRYWADNQVSCTVQFRPEEGGSISKVLSSFEDHLKGISFLPLESHGYHQAPYEPSTPEEVESYIARLGELDFSHCLTEDAEATKFCDGDKCVI
jgi:adenosylcobalamin-dependent ribonucleoside-triphosphate reductase